MEVKKYQAIMLEKVDKFIRILRSMEREKVMAAIRVMEEGKFELVHIKVLRNEVRELIIKQYRILFFISTEGNIIYLVSAFRKETRKTPIRYIEHAEKMFKLIINQDTYEKV